MKKLMLILISLIVITTFAIATTEDNAADILVKLKLMSGYEDGTLRLQNNITRAEICTLIIKAVGKPQNIEIVNKFSDMKETHWAYGTVNLAAELGFINGYPDGTFGPSSNITYAECSAILVNVLGRKDELTGAWPDNVTDKASELGLTKDLDTLKSSHKMTRGEVSIMLVNSLSVESKNQYTYDYARKD